MIDTHLVFARRLVDGQGGDGPAWLRIGNGRVLERGPGPPPSTPDVTLDTAVPGFVDAHVHGAVGVDFGAVGVDPTPAIEHHARAGSTTLMLSLATARIHVTVARLRELAPLVHARDAAGLHLEGPWLSSERRGAHDPRLLRSPDPRDVDHLLTAADGTVRMVTIAPELPGAPDAIAHLVSLGVTVALGHTAADADTVRRAVDRGATVITHLFNGMPPLHHRSPGPVGVALTDDRLTVEVIADGTHVDDEAVDVARRAAPGRLTLVSDAIAATGLGDGRYRLGDSEVVVEKGVAELADRSSLAGSTTHVGGAVARLLARGVPLPELAAATSAVPARRHGLAGHALAVGDRADLVALGPTGYPARVLRAGTWLRPHPEPDGDHPSRPGAERPRDSHRPHR